MAWLDDLKAGDRVLWKKGGSYLLKTVEKVTKVHVWTSGSKFTRSNGYEVGGDRFDRCRLVEPTPELLQQLKEKQDMQSRFTAARMVVEGTLWRTVSLEKLEAIAKILQD